MPLCALKSEDDKLNYIKPEYRIPLYVYSIRYVLKSNQEKKTNLKFFKFLNQPIGYIDLCSIII